MLNLNGRGSYLTTDYFPPVDISKGEWEIRPIDLMIFNSITNVETGKNYKIYYGANSVITIDVGAYKLESF